MLGRTLLSACAFAAGLATTAYGGSAEQWPLSSEPIRVMNTLSTLQHYGPKAGFHHGLDLRKAAGTPVFAPVTGKVSTGYYYRRKTPYTYEVAVKTKEGRRWEFHHLAPDTVPEAVEEKAAAGGTVEAGELLGRIYDASAMDIPPHVHINVVGADGYYLNPLRFLPPLPDETAPTIRGVYLESGKGDAVRLGERTEVAPASHELVLDAYDLLPPSQLKQALYALEVSLDGQRIGGFRFDRLPRKDFLEGVSVVYRLELLPLADGKTLGNRVEEQGPRRFLYAVPVDLADAEPGHTLRLRIRATDFAGNATEVVTRLRVVERAEDGT